MMFDSDYHIILLEPGPELLIEVACCGPDWKTKQNKYLF